MNVCVYVYAKLQNGPKTTITFDNNSKFSGTQTLSFSNLLGVFTELTENCYTHDYGLLE